MSSWGNTANGLLNPFGKPLFKLANNFITQQSGTTGNTANGILGINAATKSSNTIGANITHSGWIAYSLGRGAVVGFNITNAGRGYSNGDVLTVTGGGAASNQTNAVASVNANGSILSVTLNSSNSVYNSAPTTTFGNVLNTATAVLTPVMGGRTGRFQGEVLVATGSIRT